MNIIDQLLSKKSEMQNGHHVLEPLVKSLSAPVKESEKIGKKEKEKTKLKRSVTKTALGKLCLTMFSIVAAIPKVTSYTYFLFVKDIFPRMEITFSLCVPLIIATSVPFFPLAALFVIMVYNSPCD